MACVAIARSWKFACTICSKSWTWFFLFFLFGFPGAPLLFFPLSLIPSAFLIRFFHLSFFFAPSSSSCTYSVACETWCYVEESCKSWGRGTGWNERRLKLPTLCWLHKNAWNAALTEGYRHGIFPASFSHLHSITALLLSSSSLTKLLLLLQPDFFPFLLLNLLISFLPLLLTSTWCHSISECVDCEAAMLHQTAFFHFCLSHSWSFASFFDRWNKESDKIARITHTESRQQWNISFPPDLILSLCSHPRILPSCLCLHLCPLRECLLPSARCTSHWHTKYTDRHLVQWIMSSSKEGGNRSVSRCCLFPTVKSRRRQREKV